MNRDWGEQQAFEGDPTTWPGDNPLISPADATSSEPYDEVGDVIVWGDLPERETTAEPEIPVIGGPYTPVFEPFDPGRGGAAFGDRFSDLLGDLACRSVDSSSVDSAAPEEVAAIDALTNTAIPATTNLLNSIPGGTVFHMPDGARVTIEELRLLWSLADFEVLQDFDPGNGGVGEADRNGGNPIFRIDTDGLNRYLGNNWGFTYYPLHELAHVTLAGFNYHNAGQGFAMNESYANALAAAVAAAAGQPFDPLYLDLLETDVQSGVTTTMGNGAPGTIAPGSPCGG